MIEKTEDKSQMREDSHSDEIVDLVDERSANVDENESGSRLPSLPMTNKQIYIDLIKLALPLTLSSYVQTSSSIFVSWQISRLGNEAIAEYSLAKHSVPLLLTVGSLFAPLAGRLALLNEKVQNKSKVRHALQAAWLGTLMLCVPIDIGLFFTQNVLEAIGLSKNLTDGAGLFAKFYILNVQFILLNLSDLAFLEATKKQNFIFLYQVVNSATRMLLSYVLTTQQSGFPQLGIVGLSLSEGGPALVGFVLLKLIIRFNKDTNEYRVFRIDRGEWRSLFHELKIQIILGLPVMIYRLTLAGQEFVSGMVIGWQGTDQLALNSASGFYISFLSPIVDGLASATLVQAGRYFGSHSIREMKQMLKLSLITSLGVAGIAAIPYLAFPNQLASNFMGDISHLTISVRGVFALMLVGWTLEKVKAIGSATLIGMGDPKMPALGNVIADLLFIIPGVLLIGLLTDYGLMGVDSAITIGFAIATVIIMTGLGNKLVRESRVEVITEETIELSHIEENSSVCPPNSLVRFFSARADGQVEPYPADLPRYV